MSQGGELAIAFVFDDLEVFRSRRAREVSLVTKEDLDEVWVERRDSFDDGEGLLTSLFVPDLEEASLVESGDDLMRGAAPVEAGGDEDVGISQDRRDKHGSQGKSAWGGALRECAGEERNIVSSEANARLIYPGRKGPRFLRSRY